MNITAGAATALALKPWVLAEEQEWKSPVVYPDPAVEVIDPRFAKYKVINAAFSVALRTTATATIGTGRAGCSLASTTRAG